MLNALRSPLRGQPSNTSFSRQPNATRVASDPLGGERDSLLLQSFSGGVGTNNGASLQRGVEVAFPNPMGGPSTTSSAVSSGGASSPPLLLTASSGGQLQQLAALIGVLCGIQRHHCLVVHEWDSHGDVVAGHTIPLACAVPQLVPVVEFIITRATKEEQLCTFLLHADTNHAMVDSHRRGPPAGGGNSSNQQGGGGALGNERGAQPPRGHYRFPSSTSSGAAESEDHGGNTTTFDLLGGGGQQSSGGGGGLQSGVPKVVFLYNICLASNAVQDAIMDLLVHSIITVNNTPRRVPQLRVVAFCGSEQLQYVPMHIRTSFLVSTYITSAALRTAQAFDNHGSVAAQLFSQRRCQEMYVSFAQLSGDLNAGSGRGVSSARHLNSHNNRTYASATAALPVNPLMVMMPSHHRFGEPPSLLDHVHVAPCVGRYFRHLLGVIRGSLSPVAIQGHGLLSKYDDMIDLLKALVWLLHFSDAAPDGVVGVRPSSSDAGSSKRLIVGPSEVQCLLPSLVTHHLHLPRKEWGLFCGKLGNSAVSADVLAPPVTELTQASAVAGMTAASFGSALVGGDTALQLRRQYLQNVGGMWSSAIGLPLVWSAEWDAVASSRRRPSHTTLDAQFQLGANTRRYSNTLPNAAEITRRPPLPHSAENSLHAATSDDALAMTARGASASHADGVGSFGSLPFDDGSSTSLTYTWCRHLVASTLRDRSDPPPG